MNLYLESGEEVRVAIETGFLEHVLETAALRPISPTGPPTPAYNQRGVEH